MSLISSFSKRATHLLHRLSGAEGVLRGQSQNQKQIISELTRHRHQLDQLTSRLELSGIDERLLAESITVRRFRDLIALLRPMDVIGAKYRRIGRSHDGGYVMIDAPPRGRIEAAYSLGICDDVSWDEDIANEGIPVFMYDHTINGLPKTHPLFHFFKEGVSGSPAGGDLKTLSSLIKRNGHQNAANLILKMDIEGHEWGVFEETPIDTIGQFYQIVIELHNLNPNKTDQEFSRDISILKKINDTHQSVHVHANGYCQVHWVGGFALPSHLEVTFVRRSDYPDSFAPSTRSFPTELDQPTAPWLPEISLEAFGRSGLAKWSPKL